MSEFIGPALPPGFQQESHSPSTSPTVDPPLRSTSYGPSLPDTVSVGRTTVPLSDEDEEVETRLETTSYGPCLPLDLRINPTTDGSGSEPPSAVVRGPVLPPEFRRSKEESDDIPGPRLPPGFSRDEDGDESEIIGPLPATSGAVVDTTSKSVIREQVESRSKAMKDRLTGRDKEEAKPQREDWMLVLPDEFKPSGIGPRKFRTVVTDSGDRSVWTDTPADRLKKAQEGYMKSKKKESKEVQRSTRDKELEDYVKNYNETNRPESLMTMHRKRRAEEHREKGGVKERKPFNRETDLEVGPNLVTPAKRQALMKDSKHTLQSKFTRGSRSFL